MRLVACSLIILAGAIALGLGAISDHGRGADAQGVGYLLAIIGGVLFVKEYAWPPERARGDVEHLKIKTPERFEPPSHTQDV